MKKNKSNGKWVCRVTILAFFISIFLGLVTNTVVNDLNIIIAFAVLIIVMTLVCDILYKVVDPRIDYE